MGTGNSAWAGLVAGTDVAGCAQGRSEGHSKPASSNFEYGARLTEIVLLGNVALRSGKKIEWDSANLKAKNAAEADRLIKEEYRKGWEIG